MKIIEGSLAGTIINYKEQKGTRVTSEKVRKAVFDVLKSRIDFTEINVADIFCGSGMYGIEAISRGAGSAWFIDESKNIVEQLKKNIGNIEILRNYDIKILNKKFEAFVKNCDERFDLVFADPPYYNFDFEKLNEVHKILNQNGLFVLEQSKRGGIKELNGLELFLEKKYGDSVVCFYKNGNR
ncbi:MAG: RsmD family RNA methyltransferase [Patescibacteria group bacterium]|nr:RsmD family RNA methyltransferase [Patescibacteria group bacterium]